MANSIETDEAAHFELPHVALHCLQIQLFFSFGSVDNLGKFVVTYFAVLARFLRTCAEKP